MVLIGIMSVSACGKKPQHVDLPEDSESNGFPRTYPKPEPSPFQPEMPAPQNPQQNNIPAP